MPTASERPWAMRAPVETTACTMPVSIILEMTLPIFAMVIAPESVRTTVQSGSFTMAVVTSRASPSERPEKAVLDMAFSRPAKDFTLSRSRLSSGVEPVLAPVVELARVGHVRHRSGGARAGKAPARAARARPGDTARGATGRAAPPPRGPLPRLRPPVRHPRPARARARADERRRPRGGRPRRVGAGLRHRRADQEEHRLGARCPRSGARGRGRRARPARGGAKARGRCATAG